MNSTKAHAIDTLLSFGIDVDPDNCDTGAMRADAEDIYNGVCPLHMDALPPRFAADLLVTLADILDARA